MQGEEKTTTTKKQTNWECSSLAVHTASDNTLGRIGLGNPD